MNTIKKKKNPAWPIIWWTFPPVSGAERPRMLGSERYNSASSPMSGANEVFGAGQPVGEHDAIHFLRHQ